MKGCIDKRIKHLYNNSELKFNTKLQQMNALSLLFLSLKQLYLGFYKSVATVSFVVLYNIYNLRTKQIYVLNISLIYLN